MYLSADDPNVEEFTIEAANSVLKFIDLQLKACHVGVPGSLIPSMPAFFFDFTLGRADDTGEPQHFEVYIDPLGLGDLASMCSRALGGVLGAMADEIEQQATALAADMAAMRAEQGE